VWESGRCGGLGWRVLGVLGLCVCVRGVGKGWSLPALGPNLKPSARSTGTA
jgi:hypothetical protein